MNITALIFLAIAIPFIVLLLFSCQVNTQNKTNLHSKQHPSKTTITTSKIPPKTDQLTKNVIDYNPPSPSLYDLSIGSPTPAVVEFSNDPKPFNPDVSTDNNIAVSNSNKKQRQRISQKDDTGSTSKF